MKVNLTLAPISLNYNTDNIVDKNNVSKSISQNSLFQLLANQPWSMWLDSCESDHIDSRFDIMVWQPITTLETVGEQTKITHFKEQGIEESEFSNEDPLLLVKQYQQQLVNLSALSTTHNKLPFKGGAVGYFGYDLGRRFEKIPTHADQDIKAPDMAVGIYNQALIYDRHNKQHYLLCPEHKKAELTNWFKTTIFPNQAEFSLTSPWQTNMNERDYQEKFHCVQDYLLSGDCYQINLAQRFQAQYQGDEYQAYLALRAENKAPFSAFIRLKEQTILSVSPERFLRLNAGKVQSKPIKGTRPRSSIAKQDQDNANELLNASKDRAENLMIVDLLRNDISRVCQAGSVTVPSLFAIESFPAVHHLVSTVEGTLAPQFDGSDLLRAAFPGGSITGAPKIRAMEIIEELEPHRRNIYCGSIGYLSVCGNMDTSITIRTLIAEKNQLYCWAGGGLVADSNATSEYQETFDKVEKILPVLTKLNSH